MIYLQLFLSFLQIGAFSFGGGYAAMPLIQHQVVELHGWLSMNQFTDLVTISQMTPGPIAINAATFVGTQIAGVPGALAATAGCVLPSCIIAAILANLYIRYRNLKVMQGILGSLRPAVVSMIAAAGLSILISAFWVSGAFSLAASNIRIRSVIYFATALLLLRKTKLNPIWVMLLCGVAEVLFTLVAT
ncbi:chromate transporter [Roseburia hominis]